MIVVYEIIIEKIKANQKIIIHRHIDPDLDALGAQLGMKGIIVSNFPGKEVYVVGEENEYDYLGKMDQIDDDVYEGALVIILDVSIAHRVSDQRYRLGKDILVIDHHLNDSDLGGSLVNNASSIATCQILGEICIIHGFMIDEDTATALYAGLVTDSGRFLYSGTNELTFEVAAYLVSQGAKIQMIYDTLYTETLSFKKLRGYFISNFQTTSKGVAYMKNEKTLKDIYQVSTFAVSRGMVNQMSGIKGIEIWGNFTEDDFGMIQCELRSKQLSIVEVAKKYGGGGHRLACGCTVKDFGEVDDILRDLDLLLEESRINHG